nr:hypothetical protein Iba_chr10dCG12850 [Ipomoea batatas]
MARGLKKGLRLLIEKRLNNVIIEMGSEAAISCMNIDPEGVEEKEPLISPCRWLVGQLEWWGTTVLEDTPRWHGIISSKRMLVEP